MTDKKTDTCPAHPEGCPEPQCEVCTWLDCDRKTAAKLPQEAAESIEARIASSFATGMALVATTLQFRQPLHLCGEHFAIAELCRAGLHAKYALLARAAAEAAKKDAPKAEPAALDRTLN